MSLQATQTLILTYTFSIVYMLPAKLLLSADVLHIQHVDFAVFVSLLSVGGYLAYLRLI